MAQLLKQGNTYWYEVSQGKFSAVPSLDAAKKQGIDLGSAKTVSNQPNTVVPWSTGGSSSSSPSTPKPARATGQTANPTPNTSASLMINKSPTPGIPTSGLYKQGNTYFNNGVAVSSLDEAKKLGLDLGSAKDITPNTGQIMDSMQNQLNFSQPDSFSAILSKFPQFPTQESSVNVDAEMRKTMGQAALTQELADIDVQIANMQAQTEGAILEAGNELSPMATIQARKNQISNEQGIEMNRLQNIKIAKQNQLANQNATIANMMQLKQTDYSNAVQAYQIQYNQAMDFYKLFKAEQQQIKSDSLANLNVMMTGMKDSNTLWENLTPTMQTYMEGLALKSGFATEFLPMLTKISNSSKPFGSPIVSNSGVVSVLTVDKQGNIKSQIIRGVQGPVKGGGTYSGDTLGNTLGMDNKTATAFNNDFEQVYNKVISGDYGTQGSRETAGNFLAHKYPNFQNKIWGLVYGNDKFNAVFPDGYENRIKGNDSGNDVVVDVPKWKSDLGIYPGMSKTEEAEILKNSGQSGGIQSREQIKTKLQTYQGQGYTRKELEDSIKSTNKLESLPTMYKEILDELYGPGKWWNPLD